MTTSLESKMRVAREPKPAKRGSRRKRSRLSKVGLGEMIDAALAKLITFKIGGELKRIPVFQAILLVLWAAEMQGDARAAKVRLSYEAFARAQRIVSEPEIVVIGGLPKLPAPDESADVR